MKTLIITAMLGDYSKVSEEIEKEFETKKEPAGPDTTECKSSDIKEDGEFVTIHAYDMISRAYDAKCDECKSLKHKIAELQQEINEKEADFIFMNKALHEQCNYLKEQNKQLLDDLNDVAKQIEQIETKIKIRLKLNNYGMEKH